jgi:hypothetical protein
MINWFLAEPWVFALEEVSTFKASYWFLQDRGNWFCPQESKEYKVRMEQF